jgi:leader peptidase (prepilin peptidase)/N-methyltransferase
MNQVPWSDVVEAISTLAFVAQLGILAFSDAMTFRLPLRINLAFCASGLALGGHVFGTPLQDRLFGALAAYLALSLVASLYVLIRKRHGLGGGDPILLAGIGAWLGWQSLPMTVFLASLFGLVFAVFKYAPGSVSSQWSTVRLPLGTLLSIASILLLGAGYIIGL